LRFYNRYIIYAILLTCLGWLLSACGIVSPTLAKPTLTPSPSLTATGTSVPTLTPTPTSEPPTAVLLAPAGDDQAYAGGRLQTALNDIVTGQGLRWQVRQSLSMDDLTSALRLVVAVPPDPGLSELTSNAPETQFLALGIPGLEPAPNLTVFDADGNQPDQHGFIAGVIAAMLAPDWRVGVISLSDTTEGRSARTGFLNGVEYFCGLCRPLHPPYYAYPLTFELPSTASTAEWQEAANYMVDHFAQTVYIFPEAGDENMLSVLANAGVNTISSGEPPEAVASNWVVSLDADPLPIIKDLVQGLLDGSLTGGQSLFVPIQFTHINPDLFTPGKQRLGDQILSDLQNGYIDTGVDLTTGENHP
jgi:hypothetical protein